VTDPRLRSAHLYRDLERLRAQVELSWDKEAELLRRLGLRDGMSVVDLGSGPGFFAERLLELLPASSVTAVDLDPDMNQAAAQRLAAHAARVAVVEASVTNTTLDEDSFDFAIARFVFQHLHAPDLAAAEMFHILDPGGRAVVIDVDDACGGFVAPRFPALDAVGPKVAELQGARAGDRYVGRKLWSLLAAAGFRELALHTIAVHSDEAGLEAFRQQYYPLRYRPFVGPGGLTPEQWQAYADGFAAFFAQPDAYIVQVYFVVCGLKPHVGDSVLQCD
jgi:ubiquinone/menaquinone biosynthesis C-methylase UbiE